jgi:hypothetical protein
MYKYCDCKDFKGEVNLYKANNGRNKMRTTETNKKGECIFCGHCAIENRNSLTESSKRGLTYNISAAAVGVTKYLRD